MERRTLLGALVAGLTAGLAGCSESQQSDCGAESGIHINKDVAITNTEEDETTVDIWLESWLDCSGIGGPDPTYTEEITVSIISNGHILATEVVTFTYEQCMDSYTQTISKTFDGEYDDALVSVSTTQTNSGSEK
jgi:hypothetical protein